MSPEIYAQTNPTPQKVSPLEQAMQTHETVRLDLQKEVDALESRLAASMSPVETPIELAGAKDGAPVSPHVAWVRHETDQLAGTVAQLRRITERLEV